MVEDTLNDVHSETTGADILQRPPLDQLRVARLAVVPQDDGESLRLQVALELHRLRLPVQGMSNDICAGFVHRQHDLLDGLLVQPF